MSTLGTFSIMGRLEEDAVTPPNDWLCTRWTDLCLKVLVAASSDEMASRALHDPGVLGDVLKTNEAL